MIPPETINFIISAEDESICVMYSLSTTKSCPEKAYECGKYTKTFPFLIFRELRSSCVINPIRSIVEFSYILIRTGWSNPFSFQQKYS